MEFLKALALGPFYSTYINELPFSLKNCEVTMYTDDTSISYLSKDTEEHNETLNTQWAQNADFWKFQDILQKEIKLILDIHGLKDLVRWM